MTNGTTKTRRTFPAIALGGSAALLLGAALLGASRAAPEGAPPAFAFADPAFQRVWNRTDLPVASHQATRAWYWGPSAGSTLNEIYDEGPGRIRRVQYFDKSRMEINNPSADPNGPFYVTNGLLTVELVSGEIQFGDGRYVTNALNNPPGPANIPLASDLDDANAPTYASFTKLANTHLGDHKAADRTHQAVAESVNHAGQVTPAPDKASYSVSYKTFWPLTGHNIPNVFWDFLNAHGPVSDGAHTVDAQLSAPWFFTSGYPISEAYWARVKIAGAPHDVLIQLFERRVLTYIPDYAPAWKVQMGNIGLHYQQWRYPKGLGLPGPVPTVPAPAP
ncbi:MAG: hypothetical protein ACR2M0_06270 [Chloroflexia bacterium]